MVAWLGVGVTAASAVAVFQLGRKANQLAETAKEVQQSEFSEARRLRKREADREEAVLLFFLASELTDIAVEIGTLHEFLTEDPSFSLESFVSEPDTGDKLASISWNLELPRITSVLGRLHAIGPEVGLRLARLAGDSQQIAQGIRDLADACENTDPDIDGSEVKDRIETHYNALVRLAARAFKDADDLDTRAAEIAREDSKTGGFLVWPGGA
ncbi:hypothetical protein [Stenotrophomonas maltophilia]|uniref:Uncharacterized protein n=1 Tax=Stenotrophomonas maltophilia TaxID=40324 RepID=A0AAJ2J9Q4_STEMA|nr:hypothetical protein [Stenotrophomonas maltophilia]MDT3467901.1 hypothetical protein [Stenotrophomonas maltophilia]